VMPSKTVSRTAPSEYLRGLRISGDSKIKRAAKGCAVVRRLGLYCREYRAGARPRPPEREYAQLHRCKPRAGATTFDDPKRTTARDENAATPRFGYES
jgi:hypothetical protein